MVNRQCMPVQLICHTKPYKNRNFQIDGASRYFGVNFGNALSSGMFCFRVWASVLSWAGVWVEPGKVNGGKRAVVASVKGYKVDTCGA